MNIQPQPPVQTDAADPPIRILFVMAWLVVGGEETEVRLLARTLDPTRYTIEVLPCFRMPSMPDQTHTQLEQAGVRVDRAAYDMSFDDTVKYLERRMSGFDIVVSCQNVADIYPALERMRHRPPLIEHGGLVSEALAGPKHLTARYVGVCDSIRAAAAGRMPDRPHHALAIPSMVDLTDYLPGRRQPVRTALRVEDDTVLIGWVGRLDRKKRVEDFIAAAALVTDPRACFVIVGGRDAFMPEYETELHAQAAALGLTGRLLFLGDRTDVPDLMMAMDIFVWLSRGEGMPHVIAEAGAAGLPVIATADNGAVEQIVDGRTGLFVPHESPADVANALTRLLASADLRRALGQALQAHVRGTYATHVVACQWETLFAEVLSGTPATPPTLFKSFVQGGFECSTHRLRSGKRLDVIAATGHDTHAAQDYAQLGSLGLRTLRDGLRWHLIETSPNRYDFASFVPMLQAANATQTQVIWDLLHYGWPDDIDIWTPAFVDRFSRFARFAAQTFKDHSDAVPFWCPINEISFLAWAGGDAQYLNPFGTGRGYELKVQLARASIAAMHALREIDPRARFVHCEPLIAIHHDPATGRPRSEAEGWHQAQFQAFELLSGRLWPQIGGDPRFLDVIGVNYYSNNQWIDGGSPIDIGHPFYRPLSDLLFETYARYGRPILIAETGAEGPRRADWFTYVSGETARARRRGVEVEGICLYPIADHPGWDDDRLCPNGLLAHCPQNMQRAADGPLAAAVAQFQARHGYDFQQEFSTEKPFLSES